MIPSLNQPCFCSIYKLNHNLLKKDASYTSPNGIVYLDIEKAELLTITFQQFIPNLGSEIPTVNASIFTIRKAFLSNQNFTFSKQLNNS